MTLHPQPTTDTTAWRILHDVENGVWVDHFDGRWLVQTRSGRFPDDLLDLAANNQDSKTPRLQHSMIPTPTSIYWRVRNLDAATAPAHHWGEAISEPFTVLENGVRFKVDFSAGYSPGIFLDQRENRRFVKEQARPGQKILNAFAYTGAFSVMAALSGAETTTLDLSKTYLDWTWENFALNGLDRAKHHACKGDAFEWLATFARQGRRFDGVILDPPTFSRNRKKTFQTDRDYASLAELGAKITRPGGWMLCCANTHRLAAADYQRQVEGGIRQAGRSVCEIEKKPMPAEFRGDDYLKSLRIVVG